MCSLLQEIALVAFAVFLESSSGLQDTELCNIGSSPDYCLGFWTGFFSFFLLKRPVLWTLIMQVCVQYTELNSEWVCFLLQFVEPQLLLTVSRVVSGPVHVLEDAVLIALVNHTWSSLFFQQPSLLYSSAPSVKLLKNSLELLSIIHTSIVEHWHNFLKDHVLWLFCKLCICPWMLKCVC